MKPSIIASIEEARNVALAILQPSEKELQRGLELHKNCIVAESYSLFLKAPPVTECLAAATAAGASAVEYKDLCEQQATLRWAETAELRRAYRLLWEASGVDCMFVNAGEESNQPMVLIKRLARYIHLLDAMPEIHGKATSVEAIEGLHAQGKRALLLAGNGVPLGGLQFNVEEELGYISIFRQLGIRMMHLTYNRRNLIGDGCGEAANGGLSDFGCDVVRELNRQGVMIDLAHTGWQTSLDAARISAKPVIISHAAVWELCRHIRCKSDEVIKAVVDSGGTIGITNIPRFLGGRGNIGSLLDHIDYVIRKFGIGAVTIGTDSAFVLPGISANEIPPRPPTRPRWENFWPKGYEVHLPEWNRPEQRLSMAWTNWPMFTVGLVQRGYSDEEISKIIGGNLLRVARQCLRIC